MRGQRHKLGRMSTPSSPGQGARNDPAEGYGIVRARYLDDVEVLRQDPPFVDGETIVSDRVAKLRLPR